MTGLLQPMPRRTFLFASPRSAPTLQLVAFVVTFSFLAPIACSSDDAGLSGYSTGSRSSSGGQTAGGGGNGSGGANSSSSGGGGGCLSAGGDGGDGGLGGAESDEDLSPPPIEECLDPRAQTEFCASRDAMMTQARYGFGAEPRDQPRSDESIARAFDENGCMRHDWVADSCCNPAIAPGIPQSDGTCCYASCAESCCEG